MTTNRSPQLLIIIESAETTENVIARTYTFIQEPMIVVTLGVVHLMMIHPVMVLMIAVEAAVIKTMTPTFEDLLENEESQH